MTVDDALTAGTLLGGRVQYRQRRDGHRTGIEPVLLAASVPARTGETVCEGGAGAGAATLCLAHRVPGLRCVLVEADPALAALAGENLRANGFAGEVRCDRLPFLAAALPALDHAFANPPWFPAAATRSPDPRRALARQATGGMPGSWAAALAATLRPGGTLTMIVPARDHAAAAAAIAAAGCGGIVLHPLWPRVGIAAKIAILQGRRGSRAAARIAPGLVLHEGKGYAARAVAVLRDGAPLDL